LLTPPPAEAALYDRQIRLWGLEAQNRMRRSHILLAGLGGVATEALKNIVLAGVGRVSLLDDAPVQPGDLEAGFFWREDDVGNAVSGRGGQTHTL
jgi:ubiquitin-like 1-activating enzyme E1 A